MPDRAGEMAAKEAKPVADGALPARAAGRRPAMPRAGKNALKLAEIGESEPTPTLAKLRAENQAMRRQLEEARSRIAALERLADEDALTTVANRRAFVRELSRMIAFTRRYGPPSSVVYFDVNDLKLINDTHGHPAGDAVLRHIADILCKNVRLSDLVGRLGGDEFGVILAQTNQEQAAAKALSLAEKIGRSRFRWDKIRIPVGAAYGVYSFSGSDNPQVAIEAADKAMYRQKRRAAPPG
jgi:diguanylate cyclase (GGDEF)-like protein